VTSMGSRSRDGGGALAGMPETASSRSRGMARQRGEEGADAGEASRSLAHAARRRLRLRREGRRRREGRGRH
jgi:hypothetical protein